MSVTPKTKRKLGITTILSTIFIIATLVWGTYSVMMVQFEEVRTYSPHEEYSKVAPWEYDINWAGGRSNWFDDINYTDLPLDQELPEDILDHLEDVVFYVEPVDPPQLWRTGAYDYYDGSSWSKTISDEFDAADVIMTEAEAIAQGNPIYTLYLNMTVGPNIGALDMPTLFPDIQLIENSITSTPANSILSYDLTTDEYGTLRFWPLLQGDTGETVLISYDITFTNQDLISVAAYALNGSDAPGDITALYGLLDIPLTTRVTDETALFDNVGANAFEKAMAVEVYFRDNYDLLIDEENITIRPTDDQEVTDWFIERGGGLPMDFATAYCVFMRDLGIPARITTGYSVGDIEGSYRAVKVKHMMFWAEVYIPQEFGPDEWIQVIPLDLPPDMGGAEVPTNVDESRVELILDRSPTWNYTGEIITFYAAITVDDVMITTPETISFYDTTDFVDMGYAIVDTFYATLEYTIPLNATSGFHNISATWVSDTYSVSNYTLISAVGQSTPLSSTPNIQPPDFVPSATVDVNASIGLDNYIAYWNDIMSVYGILRSGGVPVNGDTLNNNQMEIWWDDVWYGNATILSNGSYRLDILADPTDLVRMSAGNHTVRANYTGNWEGEFLTVAPGVSDDSTIEIHALVELQGFTVTPDPAFTSTNITYDGTAVFLNGTPLMNHQIEIYLNASFIGLTELTDNFGNFNFQYTIPSNYTSGIAYAYAYWTSPYILANDSISNIIPITIESEDSDITIDSNPIYPDPVITASNMTIFGYLTDVGNGSGLVGKTVDLYWDNEAGAEVLLTSNTTITDGYYQFTVQVNASDEGLVYYRTYFNSLDLGYPDAQSDILNITVKKIDIEISVQVTPNPVKVTEFVVISGTLTLPEYGGAGVPSETVSIWWGNTTHPEFMIGQNITDGSGAYSFEFQVPIAHPLETVQIWVNYTSPYINVYSNESAHLPLQITNYASLISVDFNSTICHLNQTVHIYGLLQLDNGTPLPNNYLVTITWDYGNGTTSSWEKYTNSSGYYNFYYNCTLGTDVEGDFDVSVVHISGTLLYNSSSSSNTVTLQKYQFLALSDTTAVDLKVHPDEVLVFSGNFTFVYNNAPLAYATIYIHYIAANGTHFEYPKTTDALGGFSFSYNYSMNDALGAIYIWARYNGSNPLWADQDTTNYTLSLTNYLIDLSTSTIKVDYFLDQVVYVYGRLEFNTNQTALDGQNVTIYWDYGNGTVLVFPDILTNSTGWFNFNYTLSLANETEGTVTIWANFTSAVNLWSDALSTAWPINLEFYQFTLTTFTNGSSFYLDQVVHIWGWLNYTHNGTILEGWDVTVYWDGTPYPGQTTDLAGRFDFYYNLTVPADSPDTFNIYAVFTNSVPLWDNATSQPGPSITLQLYGVTLDVTVSPNPAYLNGTLAIDVHLYFTHNMTGIDGVWVSLYWFNGTEFLMISVQTHSGGIYNYTYSGMDEDLIANVEVYGRINATLLTASNESSHELLTLQRWITDISSFSSGGAAFNVTDTVTITGTLYYVDGSVNYSGVTVEFLVNGFAVDTDVTASDGSFVGSWYIDGVTYGVGTYDITVRFNSSVNWINSYETAPPITVTVSALTVSWVFEITPNTTVYRSEALNVTVILTLSNGSYFADAEVYLMFLNLALGTDLYLFDLVTTDSMGRYSWIYFLADDAPLGITSFYAYCNTSHPIILESTTGPIDVTIAQIPVSISAIGDLTVIYLGNTLTISGNLTFGNGESPIGHQIQIYWESTPGTIIDIIDGAGTFSYGYYFDWDDSVGDDKYYQIVFISPSEAYESASSSILLIDIRDLITVILNTQITIVYMQGDVLSLTGTVTNGGGLLEGVSMQMYRDGFALTEYDATAFDGTFSISVDTSNWPAGAYVLTATPTITNYDLSGSVGNWAIEVHIATTTSVIFEDTVSIMPGEEFTFSYRVVDSDDLTPVGYNIAVYLGATFVRTIIISTSGIITVSAIVPSSWAEGTGQFTIRIDFDSSGYYAASSDETTVTIHVFVAAEFTSIDPIQTLPDAPFVISGILQDDLGNAIIDRDVEVFLRNASRTEILTTDENGRYTISIEQGFPEVSRYYYTVTFKDNGGNIVVSESYSVLIQTGFGPVSEAALLMMWAVTIVIEIVIAGLLIVRFKASRGGFSRFRFKSPSATKTTSDYGSTIR